MGFLPGLLDGQIAMPAQGLSLHPAIDLLFHDEGFCTAVGHSQTESL